RRTAATPTPMGVPAGTPTALPPQWQAVFGDAVTEEERQVIALAAELGLEVPEVGEEFGPGLPLDIAWPERKAAIVAEQLDARAQEAGAADGGTVIGYDKAGARAALATVGGTAT